DLPHFNRADIAGYALSYRRVDRVLGDVAARPEVIVLAVLFRQPSKLFFHLVGGLPHPRDHLAYAPHRLTVGRYDREGPQIVQDIFRSDGLLSYAAFCEGDILRNTTVEMMRDHQHIERFI